MPGRRHDPFLAANLKPRLDEVLGQVDTDLNQTAPHPLRRPRNLYPRIIDHDIVHGIRVPRDRRVIYGQQGKPQLCGSRSAPGNNAARGQYRPRKHAINRHESQEPIRGERRPQQHQRIPMPHALTGKPSPTDTLKRLDEVQHGLARLRASRDRYLREQGRTPRRHLTALALAAPEIGPIMIGFPGGDKVPSGAAPQPDGGNKQPDGPLAAIIFVQQNNDQPPPE